MTETITASATTVRAGTTERGAGRERIRRWPASDYGKVLLVVLAWNVALTTVAWLFGPSTPPNEGIPKTGIGSTLNLLSHTYRWDAGNYGEIAEHAYTGSYLPVRAFYPVFPICVWLVKTVSFGTLGLLTAGFVVNLIATWLAGVALLKIARFFLSTSRSHWPPKKTFADLLESVPHKR